jgi:hypothetical protein
MNRARNMCFLMTVLLALSGCGPGFDEASGKDGLRGGSAEAAVDTYLDDRVSASEGDHSDWRVFELEQPSAVTVEIWWDNPDAGGNLLLRGRSSGSSKTFEHKKGQRSESMGPFDLAEGKWYVRVQSDSGASGYTIRIVTGTSSGGGLPDF